MTTSLQIERIRDMVLSHFQVNRQEYQIVFTHGATHSLKMIGEYFPWSEHSLFGYLHENHNSVIGIREYAIQHKASFKSYALEDMDIVFNDTTTSPKLFAFPAQCNFSGIKPDLNMIKKMQDSGWQVLLDAASFLSTSRLDLSTYKPNFVVLSFYKIFGFPTGLGALLIRNDSIECLRKYYFGGGTVKVSISSERFSVFRDKVYEQFEDGTIDFLNILALPYGLQWINDLGIDNIQQHTFALTQYVYRKMISTKYNNNQDCFEIYGNHSLNDLKRQGPIITFNMFWSNGSYIGCNDILMLSSLKNIHIRSGCFCNPGACQKYLNLSVDEIKSNFEAGHVCWDNKDIINGKPNGAVRISFYSASTKEDADKFLEFLHLYFINVTQPLADQTNISSEVELESIYIYPIKSCSGFEVSQWEIVESGFLYDREWALVNTEGDYINLKNIPKLGKLRPSIDLEKRVMCISAESQGSIEVPLDMHPSEMVEIILCGEECNAFKYNETINSWLSRYAGQEVCLVRKAPDDFRTVKIHKSITLDKSSPVDLSSMKLTFTNEAQFLLINRASIRDLKSRISDDEVNDTIELNFRPNLIVNSEFPYEEDHWDVLDFDGQLLKSTGPCNRCKMICIDPNTGTLHAEPLLTLSKYRRKTGGRILFGQLYSHTSLFSTKPYIIKAKSKFKILHRSN